MSDVAGAQHRAAGEKALAGRVLIIDDEAAIRETLQLLLEDEGYEVLNAADGEEGLGQLDSQVVDLVLLDFQLPDRNGLEILQEIRDRSPEMPVIMLTAHGTPETERAALDLGAANFIAKPWTNEKLQADVRVAIGRKLAQEENILLKRQLKQRYNFESIIGKSDPMLKIFDLVSQVAPSRSTILLQGESGTGKELIAKAIHLSSPRADRPFVPVNTGSMPADLLESTLFGHVKGAFTSAISSKKGLFEMADRGTIFLDEIGNMSLETQAKLLRVMQDRRFMRLGGVQEIQVDVRVIAASNNDLRQAVKDGRFREDLYYRLNVITLELPPLRQRREDIPLLAEHFLRKYCLENEKPVRKLGPDASRALLDYNWPGNVRELENAIERAVVLSAHPVITADLFPDDIVSRGDSLPLITAKPDASLFEIMEDCERRVITSMLERCGWNQTEAAERFHVPLSTLNQKIKRLNIEIKRRGQRD
ncbi:MAG: sigma-54 dependent transcriptional regulator [Acidobacteriota bacterium]|nr:sigma-54 dependent transcriptional regulator [Acidobacteriota bacterium]